MRQIFLTKIQEAKIDYFRLNYKTNWFSVLCTDQIKLGQSVRYREYLIFETDAVVVEALNTMIKIKYKSKVFDEERYYWLTYDSDMLLS